MQGVTEATAFIDGPDGVTGLNLFPHPSHQPGNAEAHGGLGMLLVALDGDGDLLQVHVQSELEHGFQ